MDILAPRILRMSSMSIWRMSSPSSRTSPLTILPGGSGMSRISGKGAHALAAAAFANQSQGFPFLQVVGDAIDGLHHAVHCEKVGSQVPNFKKCGQRTSFFRPGAEGGQMRRISNVRPLLPTGKLVRFFAVNRLWANKKRNATYRGAIQGLSILKDRPVRGGTGHFTGTNILQVDRCNQSQIITIHRE